MKFTGHERGLRLRLRARPRLLHARHMVRWRGGSCRWIRIGTAPHRSRGIGTRTFGTTRWAKSTRPDVRRVAGAHRPPTPCPPAAPPPEEMSLENAPWTSLCLAQSPQRPHPPAIEGRRGGSLCSAQRRRRFYAEISVRSDGRSGASRNYYGTFNGSETTTLDPKPENIQLKESRQEWRIPFIAGAGGGAGTTDEQRRPASYSLDLRGDRATRLARLRFSAKPLLKQLPRAPLSASTLKTPTTGVRRSAMSAAVLLST